ncbi:Rieske 2Fe-2S domain-containing protein [Nocardia sp. NPDC059246]|uniref:Rieske 2Fe-2S domain-containing protein n=1 Tax=unclassified Nocardia TaxID=2637762 RepID=UPI00367560EF
MASVSAPARHLRPARHPQPLPPFPFGWFAVAGSADVRPGQVITRRLAGRDVVLTRLRSGRLAVSESTCPHLGAHLGQGGTVTPDGNLLRCPFHGFEFDLTDGRCAATPRPYGPPPRTARLAMLHAREVLGTILVWHGPDRGDPQWEVEDISADPDECWTPLRHNVIRFTGGHPQEVSENSVDLGHLSILHQFGAVTVRRPLETDGPYLRSAYSARLARVPVIGHLNVDFDVYVDGLGFSHVETRLPDLDRFLGSGWALRQLVMPTPTDAGTLELRLAVSVRRPDRRPGWLWTAIAYLIRAAVMVRFRGEVNSDLKIWRHKAYLDRPTLAVGDGPIGPYRRWAKQFYRENAPASAD